MKTLVIALMLLVAASAFAQDVQTEPTPALDLGSIGPDGAPLVWLVDFADPQATLPETLYLLDGRDLVVHHNPGFILVDVPPYVTDQGKVPELQFKIMLDDVRLKDWAPAEKIWPTLAGLLVAAVGSTVAEAVLPLGPFTKEAASVGVGFALGAGVWLLLR